MVGVAQQAEHWVVAPGVEGSNPFTHLSLDRLGDLCLFVVQITSAERKFFARREQQVEPRAASSVGRAADS